MPEEPKAIEVEVVEIDGAPPAPPPSNPETDEAEGPRSWQDWQHWQGRVRRLDARWWPLWVLLGIVALFLLLTAGLAIAVLFAAFRLVRGLLRALASLFSPGSGGDLRPR